MNGNIRTLVAIPSLMRPEKIGKQTLSFVAGSKFEYKIFCEPQEKNMYDFFCGTDNVVALPASGQGLGFAENYIIKWSIANGYDLTFRLDDDIRGIHRFDTDNKIDAFNITVSDIETAFATFDNLGGVQFERYRHFVLKRNNKRKNEKYIYYNPLLLGGALFIRNSAYSPVPEDLYYHNSDIIMALDMFKIGYFTLRYGLAGVDVADGVGKGGCQVYDRRKYTIQAYEFLKKSYPEVQLKETKQHWGLAIDFSRITNYGSQPIHCINEEELKQFLKTKNNI